MVIEQLAPFVSSYDFFDNMGVRVFENGHSYTGVHFSIHSNYSAVSDYERVMAASYGEERARRILGEVRHNTLYYPSLTIKNAIQAIRRRAPARGRSHAHRELDLSAGRRSGYVARAYGAVFAPHQLANLDRRA
jgi:hypothetical protein